MAAVIQERRSARIERCPACSETLTDIDGVAVCIGCGAGYCEPPAEIREAIERSAPKPSNIIVQEIGGVGPGNRGCRNCGSMFVGESCQCGAEYNRPPAEQYIATAETPKLLPALPRDVRMCSECYIERDIFEMKAICPGCGSVKEIAAPRESLRELPPTSAEPKIEIASESWPDAEQAAAMPAPEVKLAPAAASVEKEQPPQQNSQQQQRGGRPAKRR